MAEPGRGRGDNPGPVWPVPTGPPTELPPPVGAPMPVPGGRRNRVRPWWGLGDVLLAVPLILVSATLGALVALPFLGGDELDGVLDGTMDTPLPLVALSLVAQQSAQGLWPILVSKWKGLGPVRDWRLTFKPIDLGIGLGTAIMAFGFAAVAGAITSELVGLTDQAEADNTQFLTDAQGTPWFWVLVLATVVGAPLAEEVLFRGLILRAIEKRAGTVAAVIGSTFLFILPHFTGSTVEGTLVLYASIGMVGLVLAVVTVLVNRLWPAIIAHFIFNGVGVLAALGAFGEQTALPVPGF